jgi:6-phosphogluconolactonase
MCSICSANHSNYSGNCLAACHLFRNAGILQAHGVFTPYTDRHFMAVKGLIMRHSTTGRVATILAAAIATMGLMGDENMASANPKAAQEMHVYVGTYTDGKSKGIYLFRLNVAKKTMTPVGLAAETPNPTFLAIHPSKKYLYAAGEIDNFDGAKAGMISSFAVDQKSGKLTFLNRQSTKGTGPCHVIVDKAGKNVLFANYGGGSVGVLPIHPDGSLAPASGFVQHHGSSVNKQRQEGPHGHSINLDSSNKHAYAADLGLDKVMIYQFDSEQGSLKANRVPYASIAPGSGPRHFAFHPNGRNAYVINELGNTVTVFDYSPGTGALKEIQTIGSLPAGFTGTSYTAEVVVHPTGKFLYGSNRGHNSIAIFKINETTGKLTFLGTEPTQGKFPRNFVIDPSGTILIAENQDSDSLVIFSIDPATGLLKPTGQTLEVPKPVCIRMIPVR